MLKQIDESDETKKKDKCTTTDIYYSLKCLSEWIKNLESEEPKLTNLNFKKIKDDILKNVKGNEEAMKLLYHQSCQCDDDEQGEINKKIWCGHTSIIHYILYQDESLLFPFIQVQQEPDDDKVIKDL
eukprot:554284_1